MFLGRLLRRSRTEFVGAHAPSMGRMDCVAQRPRGRLKH